MARQSAPAPTECNPSPFKLARMEAHAAAGRSRPGDRADTGLAGRFTGARTPDRNEHAVETLVIQSVVGIASGYENLVN